MEAFGSDKDGRRHKREKSWKKNEETFSSRVFPLLFLQADAKADGGELAENGGRRNETLY